MDNEENKSMEEYEDRGYEARDLPQDIGMNEDTDVAEPRDLTVITAEINFYKAAAGEAILEIGSRLIEAKAQLDHGQWTDWLAEKVDFSEASARRFMRLAKAYPKRSALTVLGASKALQLLALPASERDEFVAEKHEVDGAEKTVGEMTTRELQQAIRERDEAKIEAEDRERQLRELENELARAKDAAELAGEDLRQAEEEKAELEKQLKDQPIEVQRVGPTDAELDALRKEAEKAARQKAEETIQKKIKAAELEKQKALDAKSKAERDLAALKAAQQETATVAENEKKILADRCAELQKKLAVASSSEMVVFKTHFETAQTAVNKMLDEINAKIDAGDRETGIKLAAALRQFCDAVLGSLPE